MKVAGFKRWLAGAVMLAATIAAPSLQAAIPEHWKDSGFSINADGMSLQDVLTQFAQAYGVRVNFDLKQNSMTRGRLKGDNGSDFLDRLTQTYKFRWFVYNDTLYIVPRDENASMRLEVGEDAVQDAKAALVGLGLFDSRFGWGELPDEGLVIVSGPRAYVNLARDILLPSEKKISARGKQIMMFRLKYATATDRVITVRGQSQTIPGVKSILSSLFFGPGHQIGDTRTMRDLGSSKRSRLEKDGRGGAREVANDSKDASSSQRNSNEGEHASASRHRNGSPRDEPPRIEADSALNAIMIYDYGSKRETYRALISELDVEPQQVEIEALIVDIDRSKLSEMGVEWGVRKGDVVSRINGTRTDSRGIELPLPGSTLLISNAARFYARLKAMENNGQARVLAKPTVLTLDNVAAVLDLSQTSYLPLVGERIADLADVTAGTMLRVVPRIVREGDITRVRLEVDIEDGALGDQNQKTLVTRSTISTQAIVDAQQTLMIGGYHAESLSKSREKIPMLGDVPVVGSLFGSDMESYSNRERLFLITPRLSGTAGIAAPVRSRADSAARQFLNANEQPGYMPQERHTLPERREERKPELPLAKSTPVEPLILSAPTAPVTPLKMAPGLDMATTGSGRRLKCGPPKQTPCKSL